jgi:hypothetical protein
LVLLWPRPLQLSLIRLDVYVGREAEAGLNTTVAISPRKIVSSQ